MPARRAKVGRATKILIDKIRSEGPSGLPKRPLKIRGCDVDPEEVSIDSRLLNKIVR